MSFIQHAPAPPTKLGRHRQLSPLAGVHVSPFVLGGGALGEKWAQFAGEQTQENCFRLLDAFFDAGGNFVDTANSYQDEESEQIIGEWMQRRGNRDQMVIATKYTANWKRGEDIPQKTHYIGNSVKSLHVSLEASLKKLRTSYVDILYIHAWDFTTGVAEVMNGLHHLVAQGKVLYLGISDAPAWVVTEANMYAKLTAKTPFSIYQGAWNVFSRDFERVIIPMARVHGLALAPWNVLAGGKIRTDAEEEGRKQSQEKGRVIFFGNQQFERTAEERKVCLALEEVAKQVGATNIRAVAIAYVMQKTPYVFPIIGVRKVGQLTQNLEALDISLSDEQIKSIESVLPFDVGFPHNIIGDGTTYPSEHQGAACLDKWPALQAIRPVQE
ncbi:aryl-alcohol dehydrogenase [Obba rivulosa]|uniref:Aryl-alcohol dehydrogenase n=1 Tax=Obba rivulosa TaxID=1052685 RepID=A0A8E2J7F8_9APHY|nr:aryl-alcohol dehydrogenase [Obba rivulosa]